MWPMFRIGVRLAAVVVGAAALAGCASRAARLDCDGRLSPINAPAKIEGSTKDAARATPPEAKS
jgi:hypothetical protein